MNRYGVVQNANIAYAPEMMQLTCWLGESWLELARTMQTAALYIYSLS